MSYLEKMRFLLTLLLPLNSDNGMCSFKAVSLSRKPFPILQEIVLHLMDFVRVGKSTRKAFTGTSSSVPNGSTMH